MKRYLLLTLLLSTAYAQEPERICWPDTLPEFTEDSAEFVREPVPATEGACWLLRYGDCIAGWYCEPAWARPDFRILTREIEVTTR